MVKQVLLGQTVPPEGSQLLVFFFARRGTMMLQIGVDLEIFPIFEIFPVFFRFSPGVGR